MSLEWTEVRGDAAKGAASNAGSSVGPSAIITCCVGYCVSSSLRKAGSGSKLMGECPQARHAASVDGVATGISYSSMAEIVKPAMEMGR